MSVQERILQLKQEAAEKETAARRAEEKARREEAERHRQSQLTWGKKYDTEMPSRLDLQQKAVNYLKKQGVIGMIEEGSEIPYNDWDTPFPVTPKISELDFKKIAAAMGRSFSQAWNVQIYKPDLSQSLEWDHKLKISVSNFHPLRDLGSDHTPLRYWNVNFDYQSRILEISGEKVEYQDGIPTNKQNRIELLESALARAIFNPKIITRKLRREHHFEPLYPERFGST